MPEPFVPPYLSFSDRRHQLQLMSIEELRPLGYKYRDKTGMLIFNPEERIPGFDASTEKIKQVWIERILQFELLANIIGPDYRTPSAQSPTAKAFEERMQEFMYYVPGTDLGKSNLVRFYELGLKMLGFDGRLNSLMTAFEKLRFDVDNILSHQPADEAVSRLGATMNRLEEREKAQAQTLQTEVSRAVAQAISSYSNTIATRIIDEVLHRAKEAQLFKSKKSRRRRS